MATIASLYLSECSKYRDFSTLGSETQYTSTDLPNFTHPVGEAEALPFG